MSDAAGLSSWSSKFEEWVAFAQPLLPQGKAPEAFQKYPWYTTEGEPFATLGKPASEARFGLVTTGGYSIEGEQEPMRPYPTFGDEVPQIRSIPVDVDRSKLVINHPGYDHKYAKEDINANLPFDRLNEMVEAGVIGSLSPQTLVLMGLQPNVAPLIETTIPEIVGAFKADDVEAALLVPS
ncbi:MAG: glycine/sarcosine/betaine reductase selenoprotein B family protein [Pseudomonadota bacterium]